MDKKQFKQFIVRGMVSKSGPLEFDVLFHGDHPPEKYSFSYAGQPIPADLWGLFDKRAGWLEINDQEGGVVYISVKSDGTMEQIIQGRPNAVPSIRDSVNGYEVTLPRPSLPAG